MSIVDPRVCLLVVLVSSSWYVGVRGLQNDQICKRKELSQQAGRPPTGLTASFNVTEAASRLLEDLTTRNTSEATAKLLLSREQDVAAVIAEFTGTSILVLNVRGTMKVFHNATRKTAVLWDAFNQDEGEGWVDFVLDCYTTHKTWLRPYRVKGSSGSKIGLFVTVDLDRCDPVYEEVFEGPPHCHQESTYCVSGREWGDKGSSYWCRCQEGFYRPEANFTWKGFSGEDIENGLIDSYRCEVCPAHCDICTKGGICSAKRDIYLRTVIMGLQLSCMAVTIIMALVVFKQRKCKTIASGMWTILETILLGIFLLYSTVVVRFFEPSVGQCLLEPWARELGFVICYGAIILKLYRHLIEFRTRKAHRWVVKDTDLLKYLLIMVVSLLAYMAAYTTTALDFMREDFSLLYKGRTGQGLYFEACKPMWWDYVTELGEITVLVFGIHLSYASRNARTQFHERRFLCAAICIELAVSSIFYLSRIWILPGLHPDAVLIATCLRTQCTATLTLLLVFVPKFWYQQKQVRSLAQEYSCRFPVDAFKDVNAHGPLTGNNSDVEVGEVTLADMSPDDIRAELKRLYTQLEIFKTKTICRDNPHISKRRGGRKAQHRRFSLQNLYGKHRVQKPAPEETTEAEPSRTPEDSVCSVEGASGDPQVADCSGAKA
ncbi:PREDICTED: probable G-protein coupled receptor 158 isoform X2 [Nicrophorus vespilloides]|uniref:Probable G-protein coupled receptor 158 isoform X2 n=1 Tax=Nicrophorus vespilloides TaxID=110193 RepID=A0ABM1M5C0_NICVS|nr:PREDICTED: probable G-protein coupled receptor 158 isoform X2 [Nicrophorus vespilloides]